jgi:hypothetical protein
LLTDAFAAVVSRELGFEICHVMKDNDNGGDWGLNAYPLSVRWDANCAGDEAVFRNCPGAIGAHYHTDTPGANLDTGVMCTADPNALSEHPSGFLS